MICSDVRTTAVATEDYFRNLDQEYLFQSKTRDQRLSLRERGRFHRSYLPDYGSYLADHTLVECVQLLGRLS